MRVFGHQDLLPIAAFAAATVVIFSSSISRVLDYVRQIEQETGLTLLPALLLLIVAFIFHQLRRNQLQQAKAAAADPATKAAEHRAEELELLVTSARRWGARSISTASASRCRNICRRWPAPSTCVCSCCRGLIGWRCTAIPKAPTRSCSGPISPRRRHAAARDCRAADSLGRGSGQRDGELRPRARPCPVN